MNGRNGETDWYTANGTHCNTGYVVIMRTDTIEFAELQRRYGTSQVEYMALFTEEHLENLANKKTLSEKALEL